MALLFGPVTLLRPRLQRIRRTIPDYGYVRGKSGDPQSLHKYVYCHGDPVNNSDPSGMTNVPEQGVTLTQIGSLATRVQSAVGNAYWRSLARLTPVVDAGWKTIYWADVGITTLGAAANVLPETITAASNLADRINRAYAQNTIEIPPGPSPRGFLIENIGGQQLEGMGGKYIGGNVRGIDG